MAHLYHGNYPHFILDFIDDSVKTHANTPSIASGKLLASGRPRLTRQGMNRIADPLVVPLWQCGQCFLGSAQDLHLIRHLRPFSISRMACSNGMVVSGIALAASKARISSSSSRASNSSSYRSRSRITPMRLPLLSVINRLASMEVVIDTDWLDLTLRTASLTLRDRTRSCPGIALWSSLDWRLNYIARSFTSARTISEKRSSSGPAPRNASRASIDSHSS